MHRGLTKEPPYIRARYTDEHRQVFALSSEEHLMHISCTERGAAAGTFAVAVGQVRLDALLAEHVPALGDDGVLLPHFAHAAAHERAHVFQLLLHLRAHAVQAGLPQLLHPRLQALQPSNRKGD